MNLHYRWSCLLALLPVVFWSGCAGAEELGADGFPADWGPDVFEMGSSISGTTPVSGSVPAVRGKGVRSIPIGELPMVKPDSLTMPVLTSDSVQVSLSAPVSGSVGGPVLPEVPEAEDLSRVPSDLAKLDGWGPLTGSNGGLGEKAWAGVSRSDAVEQVGRLLARPVQSPELSNALGRLLLTAAAPAGEVSGSGIAAGEWLAVRAEGLSRVNLDEQAYALWRVVPPLSRNADGPLARGWAHASLMAGQVVEPCALARKIVGQGTAGDFTPMAWREMAVVCTALDRVAGGLDMSLAVAGEDGGFDPVLRKLLVAIRDDEVPVKIGPKDEISDLSAAVLATYPSLLEPEVLPRLPAVVLRRLVQTVTLPLAMRARAAEVLAQRLPQPVEAETVRVLYEAFGYPPDQVGHALDVAQTLDGTAARALLWQAARGAVLADDKVRAWGAFAARADADGLGALALGLGPSRAGIVVSGTMAGSPAAISTALVGAQVAWQAGDGRQANVWKQSLDATDTVTSPTVALVALRARLSVEGAVTEGVLGDAAFSQWLVTEGMGGTDAATVVRALAVLDGLGVELPADAWGRVEQLTALREASGGDMVRVEALEQEAAAKQVGSVIVRLASWAQEKPPAVWAPLEAKAAVAALRTVGLKDVAQRLGWEILRGEVVAVVKPVPKKLEAKPAVKTDGKAVSGTGLPPVKIQGMRRITPERKPGLLPPPVGVH